MLKRLSAVFLAILLLLTHCAAFAEGAQGETTTEETPVLEELVVANPTVVRGEWFTEMWGNSTTDIDVRILIHGYNLVMWESALGTFKPDPMVVRKVITHDLEDGSRTYTFYLKTDLKYSDGSKITAWDYAFSQLFVVAPEIYDCGGTPVHEDYLVGYDQYVSGELSYFPGVRVLNDYTLQFTVQDEYVPFFYEYGLFYCTPFPIKEIAPGVVVKDDGDGVYLANEDETITEPIFTADLIKKTVLDPETGYLSHPSVVSDVNGQYPIMEFGNPEAEDSFRIMTGKPGQAQRKLRERGIGTSYEGVRYSVFSLWDTCRNLHQLLSLVYPERQVDMVRSVIGMYRDWGWLPKWELFGRETWTMEGDPAVPMIVDSWFKLDALHPFDMLSAEKAFLKSSDTPGPGNRMRPDINHYLERGYIPLGFFSQDFSGDNSVSHALEYYVADAALARYFAACAQMPRTSRGMTENPVKSVIASECGQSDADLAAKFKARSLGYRHYYSRESGTLRPLRPDGTFLTPFDPKAGADFSNAPGFHEGSAWNYTFYVPHDVEGLAGLMGGTKAFVKKLRKVFDEGLYDPANEPDIAYPYLFSRFKGYEKETWASVDRLLATYYTDRPDGLPGNDDAGTLSAWAVFSMMGFYPDCPGDPSYTLTRPSFSKVTVTLDPAYLQGAKPELVITRRAKPSRALLGGRNRGFRVSHDDLISAGTLTWK